MPLDLSEVPSEDLIQALCRRNEASVIVLTNGDTWSVVLDGNGFTCIGMVQCALQELKLANLQFGTE